MTGFTSVCARCFSDRDLVEMIRDHAGPRGCYFCERRDAPTMPFDDVVEFILERIETFYGRAGDQLPFESREGGYQAWHIDSYDMIRDEIELDLPRDASDDLFRAIVDGIGDDVWCAYDWLTLEPDESLRFSWDRFCQIVKHSRRFFFHDIGKSEGRDPDSRSPFQLLGNVCHHADDAGLVVTIPEGLKLYRARSRKGKAHKPYEFGVKVSVATTLNRSKGGQFALHAMALPGNPYDGHTLATVIPDMEQTIGNELSRILADAGYRGHNAPESRAMPSTRFSPPSATTSRFCSSGSDNFCA